MISIGGTRQDERKCDALLTAPHELSIRVCVLDLDHNVRKDVTNFFADGQISVDADADVTRGLDLNLLDPLQRVSLDFDDPSPTSIYLIDMIRVYYVIRDHAGSSPTYQIPVFTGPVSAVERNDVILSVKAVGKESLGMTNLWGGRTFKKGQEKLWVIQQILTDLMGETRLQIPNAINGKSPRLSEDKKLTRDDVPWKVAKQLAASMNCQLFYDGRGVAVLRKKQNGEVWEANRQHLSAEPDVAYDLSTTINAVEVVGATPKKAKKPVKARAIAQRAHPLSPYRLGRGGKPRFLWVSIQDDSLRTVKDCRELANQTLKHGLMAGITVAVDGIVNPRLQELDVMRFRTDLMTAQMPVRKFVIPLIAGASGSYGYLRKIRPRGGHRPIPRHHHGHHGHGNHHRRSA